MKLDKREFNFCHRFDGGSPFAVRTKTFFEYLGLDHLGKVPVPRTKTAKEFLKTDLKIEK